MCRPDPGFWGKLTNPLDKRYRLNTIRRFAFRTVGLIDKTLGSERPRRSALAHFLMKKSMARQDDTFGTYFRSMEAARASAASASAPILLMSSPAGMMSRTNPADWPA